MRLLAPLLAAVGVGWLGACARQGAPPGGPVDVRPPVVVVTRPDTFDVGPSFEGPVRFQFDERISEAVATGLLDNAITVSPRTGNVRVRHGRRSLSIEVEGGFRPGLVYRVTLLPVVRDLFGNQLRDPFELVFSTGGEAVETTLAGDVWNRVTGRGVPQASLHAFGEDGLVHVAIADADGIFAFRYLPEGAFRVIGYVDQDRDGEVGENETQGGRNIVAVAGDTLLIDVPVLAPDSTPAILLRAEMLDSVTLALEFDDFLEPEAPLSGVSILLEADSTDPPGVLRLWHEHEYADFVQVVADSLARLDSIDAAEREAQPAPPPDTPVADPVETADSAGEPPDALPDSSSEAQDSVPGPPQRVPPARLARARGSDSAPPGRPVLPGTRVVALLDADPGPGVELRLTVSGVVNLNGLTGGGGETTLRIPEPTMDSVSAGVPPDTTRASGVVFEIGRWLAWPLFGRKAP